MFKPQVANYWPMHGCTSFVILSQRLSVFGAALMQCRLYEPCARTPVFGVSDQVKHKPGCTATEDGLRLEISDIVRREIVLHSVQKETQTLHKIY